MLEKSFSLGLRHVLVHVTFGSIFPPVSNSEEDVALLRAANRALQRTAQGADDAFLFVLVGNQNVTRAKEALFALGFRKATVICLEHNQDLSNENEEFDTSESARAIEEWLRQKHPGAVATIGRDYDVTKFWWSGVESCDPGFDWPFDDGDFADVLPSTHADKAATWLAILAIATDVQGDCRTQVPMNFITYKRKFWRLRFVSGCMVSRRQAETISIRLSRNIRRY